MHHRTEKKYIYMVGLLVFCQHLFKAWRWNDPPDTAHCLLFEKYCRQLLILAAAPVASPGVDHPTSTILTSVEELSCQAFILLRDQGPSCSYLNITLVFCGFGTAGAGGISFMWALNTQNALAWPLGFGGIIWWIHVLQQLLAKSQQGSKSDKKALHQFGHMVTFIFVHL